MSSLLKVPSDANRHLAAVRHGASRQTALTARLAGDEQTKIDAYQVRHKSYLSGGFIDPMPGGLFWDQDDLKPNAQSIVIYKEKRPVASVRLCMLDADLGKPGWDEIPARRIFPEAISTLLAALPAGRPARLTEINRLVRHPDFATDYELVFVLFRFVAFMVGRDRSQQTLSCVRRNHTPFYRRLHFDYVAGPRRYAGVKFETNLMACANASYGAVLQDLPFADPGAAGGSPYEGLLHGETVSVF